MQKTRVMIIGAGSIGERHLRCFLATGRVDGSICEIDQTLRERIVQRYSLRQSFADLDEAIRHRPDAAIICTPAHLHIPMALRLAQAGVHLLIEKPLGTSTDDVDRLGEIVEAKNLTAGVAYVLRMNPLLRDMRKGILSGRFGEPVQLIAQSGQHFPHYRPAYQNTYYVDRATGGGAIQDALTHLIDAGSWIVGPLTRLVADADHLVLEGVEVEDTVHLIARHGAVMGSYLLNQHQAPNETMITVVCRGGTVRCELHANRWLSTESPRDDWVVEAEQSLQRDDLFVAQANAFLDAIAGQSPPDCSLKEGLQTLRVNLAILRAVDTHQWQTP